MAILKGGSFVGGDLIVSENIFTNIVNVNTGFKLVGGTSGQFLKADGSTDSNTYSLTNHSHDLSGYLTKNEAGYTYAYSGHTHSGVYQPVMGSDDNYVTDDEKVKLSNLSGTNTGDQNLSGYLTKTEAGYTYSLTGHTHSYLPLAGGTMTGTIVRNIADGTNVSIIQGTMGTNDSYRILAGGENNAGYFEIATCDDGTEPIYIRQYSGNFGTVTNSVTILDGDGNSNFSGNIASKSFTAHGNASDTYYFSGNRDGVGTTFTIYDNGNTTYLNSYSGMSFRGNFLGGTNGSFSFSGADVLINSNVRAIQHQYESNAAYTKYNSTTKSIDFIFN